MSSARRIGWLALVSMLAGDMLAFAQIGGPFPGGGYPPGRYPGGGYPPGSYPGGGGAGIPMPGRRKKSSQKEDTQATTSLTGMLRSLNEKQLILEAQDTRIIGLKRTEKTKFLNDGDAMKPSDLKPGDHLDIDATQDDQGFYTAITVNFEKSGTAAERTAASKPVEVSTQASEGGGGDGDDDPDRPRLRRAGSPQQTESEAPEAPGAAPSPQTKPTTAQAPRPAPARDVASDEPLAPAPRDPDDPGPPALRRGGPAVRRKTEEIATNRAPASAENRDAPEAPPERTRPSVLRGDAPRAPENLPPLDPMIAMARDAAESFSETLPNYVCQQFTSRFQNTSHITNWQAIDVVSAEVVYENGRENYRNLKINNKPVRKGMEELSGAWSTGEFGTLLRDIFSPATSAEFHYRKDSTIAGMSAALYDFKVEHENSHWRVQVPSQSVFPAYKGSVWIDKKNGRLLRIEMQARNVPTEFPLDTVETVADYEYVRIGGAQQFLLPVHAETLSCQRGTNNCARNSIDFRNYKKYSGEASITFDKP